MSFTSTTAIRVQLLVQHLWSQCVRQMRQALDHSSLSRVDAKSLSNSTILTAMLYTFLSSSQCCFTGALDEVSHTHRRITDSWMHVLIKFAISIT